MTGKHNEEEALEHGDIEDTARIGMGAAIPTHTHYCFHAHRGWVGRRDWGDN